MDLQVSVKCQSKKKVKKKYDFFFFYICLCCVHFVPISACILEDYKWLNAAVKSEAVMLCEAIYGSL